MKDLYAVAESLVAGKRGILAADESDSTIKKRFETISLESTPETRKSYRELLFTTIGIEEFISGVIMFDETIKQRSHAGIPFAEVLSQKGIIPGIKVDKGLIDLPNFPGEKITEGLDGLKLRLVEYKALGAKFAKWRAVISIGEGIPSMVAIESASHLLARYATTCQSVGIVPIVEPEVLMDGSHDINTCREVTYKTLKTVFSELSKQKVDFKGMLLKPNMVISGNMANPKSTSKEVAELTTKVLTESLPDDIPGVVFLSGGQSPEEATLNLNEINKFAQMKWRLSFSYGRALQEPVIEVWRGNDDNKLEAQKIFLKRAKLNSLASAGLYGPEMENEQ